MKKWYQPKMEKLDVTSTKYGNAPSGDPDFVYKLNEKVTLWSYPDNGS